MPTSALLFDLDGTLIDSMPHHHVAWQEWHRRRGLHFDEDGFFTATAGPPQGANAPSGGREYTK